jgi:hypothetical protein
MGEFSFSATGCFVQNLRNATGKTIMLLGFPIPPGLVAYEAARNASEATRQSDFGTARATHGAGTTAYAAAVKVAEIAHYRRLAAAALANGIRTTGPADALRDLGTGGT